MRKRQWAGKTYPVPSVITQQLLGVVHAVPVRGITTRLLSDLTEETHQRVTFRLRNLERYGYVTFDDGRWYPTQAAESLLNRAVITEGWGEDYVGPKEAREALGVTEGQLKHMMDSGGVPFIFAPRPQQPNGRMYRRIPRTALATINGSSC